MRGDFLTAVKENLAARVGAHCSNPQCRAATSGPHFDSREVISEGVAAQICAASPGGPRHDVAQSQEQRRSIHNGIWLRQADRQQSNQIQFGSSASINLRRGVKMIRAGGPYIRTIADRD